MPSISRFVFVFTLCVLYSVNSNPLFAQRLDSATISKLPPIQKQEVYSQLKQANGAKTGAFLTIIAGGSLVLAGAILSTVDDVNHGNELNYKHQFGTGDAIIIAGVLTAASSTLFFLKMHRHRNQARAIISANKYTGATGSFLLPGIKNFGVGIVWQLGD